MNIKWSSTRLQICFLVCRGMGRGSGKTAVDKLLLSDLFKHKKNTTKHMDGGLEKSVGDHMF